MISCDLCGDIEVIWEENDMALCYSDCKNAIIQNMASPKQRIAILKAIKQYDEENHQEAIPK